MQSKIKNKIIREYQKGVKTTEICIKNHISPKTLYEILREKELPLRNTNLHDGCFCPFFASNYHFNLRCEAPIFTCAKDVTIYFKTSKELKNFKKKFCNGKYKKCKFFMMYSGEDGKD